MTNLKEALIGLRDNSRLINLDMFAHSFDSNTNLEVI